MSDISDKDFVLVNALAIDMEWVKKIQAEHEDYVASFPHQEFSAYIASLDSEGGYPSMNFNGNEKVDIKSTEIGAVVHKYDIIKTLGEQNIRKTITADYEKWIADEDGNCDPEYYNKANEKKILDQYMKELKGNYGHVSQSTDFKFYDDKEVKVFAKDLKTYDGITLQYVGIMPKQVSLSDYVSKVNAENVNKIIDNLKDIKAENFEDGVVTYVKGLIPLFDFDYELPLLKDLQKLNVTDIFDPGKADLSKMVSAEGEFIDTAVHKANIEFSNDGIKAAAATAMGGKGAADCGWDYIYEVPVKEIDLTFNKPFMFIIRDKNSGEVWFTGTVYEPKVMEEEDYYEDE
jgi:serine protease inhibitor